MIISASYRTDIPAFYGDWFRSRLDAGYCLVENPYSGQPYRVSLRREDVEGFVFWTKNTGPFLPHLAELRRRGYPFLVLYSIKGYPRALERAVVDTHRAVEHMKHLATEYGPRVPVWRYDPIVFSSVTTADFHRRNFERLARALEGISDEVTTSFVNIYQKSRRNLDAAARADGFRWFDPADEVKLALVKDLLEIARACRMQLSICAQRQYLIPGAADAHCVDAVRLSDVAGQDIAARIKGHRDGCSCFASRDIGAYDSCVHGCVYCYAVQRPDAARQQYRRHDPSGEFLIEKHNAETRSLRATDELV
ncbi:MAG: DUF1848 domain-containing protein [Chloroflexi bacterium]|nr:DUF1848 domain-containing protein [Chloroflexota bacterium]